MPACLPACLPAMLPSPLPAIPYAQTCLHPIPTISLNFRQIYIIHGSHAAAFHHSGAPHTQTFMGSHTPLHQIVNICTLIVGVV